MEISYCSWDFDKTSDSGALLRVLGHNALIEFTA